MIDVYDNNMRAVLFRVELGDLFPRPYGLEGRKFTVKESFTFSVKVGATGDLKPEAIIDGTITKRAVVVYQK